MKPNIMSTDYFLEVHDLKKYFSAGRPGLFNRRFHPRCPVAFDRCKVDDPEYAQVGEGHRAACLLAAK